MIHSNLSNALMFEIDNENTEIDADSIIRGFEELLERFGFDGISVSGVSSDYDGNVIVDFSDYEGEEMSVMFYVTDDEDEDNGAFALVLSDEMLDDEDNDESEYSIVDLSGLVYSTKATAYGTYIDLSNVQDWMTRSFLDTILSIGDIQERFATVVRGGKRVRLPVVRRKRRKYLSSKRKLGFRKAALKRKTKKTRTARKLKRSLKRRKNMGLGRQSIPSKYKIGQG